jgi:uncharacterized protein DUF4145
MAEKYVPPAFTSENFHCPHCGVHAHHYWYTVYRAAPAQPPIEVPELRLSICNHCKKHLVWHMKALIYPKASSAPMPSEEMPTDVEADYTEARNLVGDSPRAAAALLRLAVQKLMPHLGEKGKDLDHDIGELVKKGLPEKIKKGFDSLRVIGNNAVHPGQIDLKDDKATATSLFELLNMIVDVTIAQPKRVDEIYAKVPDSAKDAIQKRDRPAGGS